MLIYNCLEAMPTASQLHKGRNGIQDRAVLQDEDEQLARALAASMQDAGPSTQPQPERPSNGTQSGASSAAGRHDGTSSQATPPSVAPEKQKGKCRRQPPLQARGPGGHKERELRKRGLIWRPITASGGIISRHMRLSTEIRTLDVS